MADESPDVIPVGSVDRTDTDQDALDVSVVNETPAMVDNSLISCDDETTKFSVDELDVIIPTDDDEIEDEEELQAEEEEKKDGEQQEEVGKAADADTEADKDDSKDGKNDVGDDDDEPEIETEIM